MSSTLETRTLDSAKILAQITGQNLPNQHLTPQIMFLSAMTSVLAGVAYSDGQLTDQEKLCFKETLSQLVSPKSSAGKIISLMLKGIQKHKIYTDIDAIGCLANELSVSEKLIILGFGHRLAIADGYVEAKERQYLDTVASAIGVPDQHVKAFFSCLDNKQSEVSPDAIEELRWLLDPQRFQNIDPEVVRAASFFPSKFLTQPKNVSQLNSHKPSYAKLEKFQDYRKQLGLICTDLLQVMQVEEEYNIFPSVLEEEIQKLAKKVQSQKFRLAVVGEFSQGKSTFLNALLGEKIQPVRAIPCSGTLTVLKYGVEKRVVCYYKDGTQSIIPFEQYQQKASIPREAALGNQKFELPESDIAEIVLEHPGLELCRHHVEIIDSPGLNEHSARTAVTERLLQNADAAIFLTHAQRPLTQNEHGLLQNLKHRLQQEDSDTPANNLFVLVNFIDMLESAEDKADVIERVKNAVRDSENPLVNSDNRVHFISAQSALKAILMNVTNEHSKSFSEFMSVLETFLVEERGELTLRQEITGAQKSILRLQNSFQQTSDILEGKLNLSTAEQHRLLEQIGEIGGSDIKVRKLEAALLEETILDINNSWKQWLDGLKTRLYIRSKQWITCKEDKENIIKDYMKQSTKGISEELDKWLKEKAVKLIVEANLAYLASEINSKLVVIENELQSIDNDIGASLHKQFELSGSGLAASHVKWNFDVVKGSAFFKTIELVMKTLIIGHIAGAVIGFFSGKDVEKERKELKEKALYESVDQFVKASDGIIEEIIGSLKKTFDARADDFHKAADASISILCNLLEQQESIAKETLEQKEIGSEIIQQKELQLQAIEADLNILTKTALS